MNGIWRNVVWLLLPVVGACEADGGPSNTGEVTSDTSPGSQTTAPGETSSSTAEATSEATSGLGEATTSATTTTSSSSEESSVATPSPTGPASSDLSSNETAAAPIVGERALGARCARDERWGGLGVNLSSDRTIISGAVSNGVLPSSVPEVAAEEGTCQLLVPRNLLCSSCEANQACAGDDECVAKPAKVSAGTLRVDGLLTEVAVAPNAITGDYSKTVIDPFPAYTPGDALTLHADGDVVGAFEAELIGVPGLSSPLTVVSVKHGESAVLSWDAASADPEETAVFVSFSVNVHGAVTGWIECTAPDTGEFEIPADLVGQLIDLGSSGFPRVDIERRSSATVELESGCVDLYVGSKITLDIELDGLTSCHDDDDCAEGQSCNEELACE
jgi:hypothetical protein